MKRNPATPVEYTPTSVKRLVQGIAIATLTAIALNTSLHTLSFFLLGSETSSPLSFFKYVSALFVIPANDLSFSSLFDIGFALLILYSAGKTVTFAFGKRHLFILYALAGILSGITATIAMHATNYAPPFSQPFSEALPAILAITVVWIMLIPYQNLYLYFLVPIKASVLLVIAFIACVAMNMAQGDYVKAFSYLTAMCVAYLYGLLVLGLSGPFRTLINFESFLKRGASSLQMFWQWKIARWLRSRQN